MKQEAEQKWGARLMRKNTIEIAMKQHHTALDDAVRSFQVQAAPVVHSTVNIY